MIKNILITGASRGIGAALAIRLAGPNTHLFLTARTQHLLQKTAEICQQKGATVTTHLADIRQSAFGDWVKQTDQQHPLNLVIANAGISSALNQNQPEELTRLRQMIETNVLGTVNTIEPVIEGMRHRQSGHIVLMGSLASLIAMPQFPGYSLTKAGIFAYGTALRQWLKPKHIAVSIICPGFVETEMSQRLIGPKPGLCSAEKAAEIIYRGLMKQKPLIAFPRRLYWLTLLSKYCPFIRNRILAKIQYGFQPKDANEQG